MDQGRMDAEGGRALHRQKRVRTFAMVFIIQNLLVASSLLVTLYIYTHMPQSSDVVHIDFMAIADITESGPLEFDEINSQYRMDLVGRDKISVSCTGPYVLYMYLCYKSLQEHQETRGSLQLQVAGKETPLSSFNLTVLHEVCNGYHSIAYLVEGEKASLHLYREGMFKVKNVTVGLRYLLGSQCVY